MSTITITNNFNAPIGQHIDHVDKIEAHFDKDMGMQIAMSEETPIQSTETDKTVSTFLWPQYKANVSEDAKKSFENFLIQLCAKNPKNLTKSIHRYLKKKEEEGIIYRPAQINVEYEWVKAFGYPYDEKTYYND